MRHTSLLGQPKPVQLLPPGVVSPALLGLLVPAAGLPHRLISRLTTARPRAVPLPTIAVRAHHHLASASVAAQQSSVVRNTVLGPLPIFFSAADYRSARSPPPLLQIKQPITTAQRQLLLCRPLPSVTRPIDSILDLD